MSYISTNKTIEEINENNKIIKDYCCYFCREIDVNKTEMDGDIIDFYCPHCGHYKISIDAIANLHSNYKFRVLATAIAQERKLAGQDDYVLQWRSIPENDNEHQICINNVPFLNNYPIDYLEKLDRILINIGRKTNNSPIIAYIPDIHDFGLFFVEPPSSYYYGEENDYKIGIKHNINRINHTIFILKDLGWIQSPGFIENRWPPKIYLTVNGLKHIQELHNTTEEKSQAFVAMWFTDKDEYGEKLKKYVDSISNAINSTGYNLYIANQEKYNGAIMNRVINRIKESRFLIADLTCDKEDGMRGGVYYEAGLAAGLGMPVILTCNKDAHLQGLVHFDLKQFNTILWYIDENGIIRADGHPDEDFSEYLTDWIIATVGKKK